MFEDLKELASEYTEENVTLESNLRGELGLTSFDLISLISEVEEKYNVHIEETDLESIITVQDLINYIESKQ